MHVDQLTLSFGRRISNGMGIMSEYVKDRIDEINGDNKSLKKERTKLKKELEYTERRLKEVYC